MLENHLPSRQSLHGTETGADLDVKEILQPIDDISITILVDNTYDALLVGSPSVKRTPPNEARCASAEQFAGGQTTPGLIAEHGFAALVTTRDAGQEHSLLFDTGISPNGLNLNMLQLGIDPAIIEEVVVSHGHYDHTGGLLEFRALLDHDLDLLLHPNAWAKRRLVFPDQDPIGLPALSKGQIEQCGYRVIESTIPSLVMGGNGLITGELDRVTDFEVGMAYHQTWLDGKFIDDPWILDDQALVVNIRNRGLVIVTGCGHAGIVNIVLGAQRITGIHRICAVLGGFHLNGPTFAPIIMPTVREILSLSPEVVMPGHCTGWRAQRELSIELGNAFCPSSVGTRLWISSVV